MGFKLGTNIPNKRLEIINNHINLDLLNLGYPSFKIEVKNCSFRDENHTEIFIIITVVITFLAKLIWVLRRSIFRRSIELRLIRRRSINYGVSDIGSATFDRLAYFQSIQN